MQGDKLEDEAVMGFDPWGGDLVRLGVGTDKPHHAASKSEPSIRSVSE